MRSFVVLRGQPVSSACAEHCAIAEVREGSGHARLGHCGTL